MNKQLSKEKKKKKKEKKGPGRYDRTSNIPNRLYRFEIKQANKSNKIHGHTWHKCSLKLISNNIMPPFEDEEEED